jgi:hypothetical protein
MIPRAPGTNYRGVNLSGFCCRCDLSVSDCEQTRDSRLRILQNSNLQPNSRLGFAKNWGCCNLLSTNPQAGENQDDVDFEKPMAG